MTDAAAAFAKFTWSDPALDVRVLRAHGQNDAWFIAELLDDCTPEQITGAEEYFLAVSRAANKQRISVFQARRVAK